MAKSDSSDIRDNSNPCLSAKNVDNSPQNEAFQRYPELVWQQSVAVMEDTEQTPKRHPHKRARLIHYDYDLSKRWYVVFYAWHVGKEKLVRRRLFEPINREKTVHKRLDEADNIIRQVNRALADNKVLGKDEAIADNQRRNVMKLSLLEAVDYVKAQKELAGYRKNYIDIFKRLKAGIEKWIEHEHRSDFPVKNFSQDDAYSFFDFLQRHRKVGNKTHNNYRTDLAIVFNFLMKRNRNLFEENPVTAIDKLPVTSRKHGAFSDQQMATIITKCKILKYKTLVLFIQMIYYTFGRPRTEVLKLKIENLDFENNRIFFPGSIAKNKRDEYVGMVAALKEILIKVKMNKYPKTFYVFGKDGRPGETPLNHQYFYKRNRIVIEELGLDKTSMRYSVYSYKHSGVIALYKATKDIKLCMSQCRHNSLDQTNGYLRDLGLLSDYDGLKNWEGSI